MWAWQFFYNSILQTRLIKFSKQKSQVIIVWINKNLSLMKRRGSTGFVKYQSSWNIEQFYKKNRDFLKFISKDYQFFNSLTLKRFILKDYFLFKSLTLWFFKDLSLSLLLIACKVSLIMIISRKFESFFLVIFYLKNKLTNLLCHRNLNKLLMVSHFVLSWLKENF